MTIQNELNNYALEIDNLLNDLLNIPTTNEAKLYEAMLYSLIGGGKKLRAFIVRATSEIFNVNRTYALRVGAAIEMVHTYSLIHDDLPCMDDDDLRRGKASLHVMYDEATAILAGDSLLTLAFGVLGHEKTHFDPKVRIELIKKLSFFSGPNGMCGGQIIDILSNKENYLFKDLERLQNLKTGSLFAFSCVAGALLGNASNDSRLALENFGKKIGLAYQIGDDILDVEGKESFLGKKVGKDSKAGKKNFVSLLGIEEAKVNVENLVNFAINDVKEKFGINANNLIKIASFIKDRNS